MAVVVELEAIPLVAVVVVVLCIGYLVDLRIGLDLAPNHASCEVGLLE